jgi:hypothetical protein
MNEKDFKKLIDKKKYQVFLCRTRVNGPFIFASHFYFVTNQKGKINRWEVIMFQARRKCKHYGNLLNNYLKPWEGFLINPFNIKSRRFEGEVYNVIEGKLAKVMTNFINKTPKIYPFIDKYLLWPGPNSNTFIQWIINHFPESKLKLSWNAFGKGYANKIQKIKIK